MFELSENDFIPLDGFSERWRFADATYGYVSPDLQERIRPLAAEPASAAGEEARSRHPAPDSRGIEGAEFDAAAEPGAVRDWLRALPVSPRAKVLVSWDARTAVLTDWEAFIAYWDDFCHTASDDVTVWSPDAQWTLAYWHDDLLRFSSRPHAI